ncbi:cytochrome b [Roseateles sp.]|uniref:cytochrome b n=1 Tax=Roseateles sp. TaxID=1971397 RepID=UPI0039537018
MRTTSDRYTLPAIALHWLLALALIGTFCLGLYAHELQFSMTKLKLMNWHKWAGITILFLSVLRLVWRVTHRPPADVPMPAWQAKVAHLLHWLMYGLFFAIPLSGWAMTSAKGYPVVLFGVLPLPDWVPKDKALGHQLEELHEMLAWLLVALVVAHVAAALKHHFIDKDGLLDRMRPGR